MFEVRFELQNYKSRVNTVSRFLMKMKDLFRYSILGDWRIQKAFLFLIVIFLWLRLL